VIEPEDGIIAIGSGGSYALSAARALLAHTQLDARAIATEALAIAGDIRIYTNRHVVVEELRAQSGAGCPPRARRPSAAPRPPRRRFPPSPANHPPATGPPPMTDPASSSAMTPREIVQELDRHIIGQQTAKRAVAIALRNRWRRAQLPDELRNEVMPKNILMI